jgi:ABC-type Na+ efflux pump permease component-like protein
VNNMRDILIVTKFTLIEALKKKAFIVSTIIMILMIILASAFTKIIPKLADSNEKDKILIVDNDNIFENQLNTMNELGLNNEFIIAKEKTSLADVKTKIKNKDIKKGIIISKAEGKIKIEYVVENTSLMMNSPVDIQKALKEIYSRNQLKKLNLTQQQIQSLEPNFEYTIVSSQEKDANKNITVILALTGLLFAAIYTFAYQVSTSITTEKTSKIVETLVTYTKARNIVLGKTFGIGLAGLIQLLIIAIISIFSINTFVDKNMLSAFLDLSTITPALGITIVVYFILGYMEYALLYALTGSFVSNPEEVKAAATPASLIAVMSFYLAYFTIMSPTSNLNSIASIVPFSSPFSAPFRVMLGVATPREMIMSVLILIATNILIAHIAIKVYTNAIINNGTKLSLKEIIKMYKTK